MKKFAVLLVAVFCSCCLAQTQFARAVRGGDWDDGVKKLIDK